MKVLLDTHIFLWWVLDDPRLSTSARAILMDGANELYLSAASGLEIAVKARLGKLSLPYELAPYLEEQMRINAIKMLPVQMRHALRVYQLPLHHRDPFDRLLIAQSQVEALALLTADPQMRWYDIELVP